MNASDLGYFALGAGFVLTVRLIIAWTDYSAAIAEARARMDAPNPDPEEGMHWSEREARRVERPLEERSVPGVVVTNQ